MKARRLKSGERFAGRYVVEAFIGQGAMGSVYAVRDEESGQARALKVMSLDLVETASFVARFVQEAKLGERVASEHVVRVFDTGVDDLHEGATKLPFFTMELLVGDDLHRLLERGEEPAREVVHALLAQLFEAVAAAHAASVVHRDLKPENLFIVRADVDATPSLKVLDFGVAKVFKESTTAHGTAPGLGSPLWTAPEQGREGQTIRPAADVWALGLISYRLLAGKVYWRAANAKGTSVFDLAVEMLREPLALASVRSREIGARDLGPAFDAWFARAVDRDPASRFKDAGAAWNELEPILQGRPSMSRPVSVAPKPDPRRAKPPRRTRLALAALVVVVALVGLVAVIAFRWAASR